MALRSWVGGNIVVPNSWFGVGNWGFTGGIIPIATPTLSDDVEILGPGSPFAQISSSSAFAGSLLIGNGNSLLINNSGTLQVASTVTVGSGSGTAVLDISGAGGEPPLGGPVKMLVHDRSVV